MSAANGKSLRLSFKGDKPKKRKRSGDKTSNGSSSSSSRRRKTGAEDTSDVEDVGGDEQAWVSVDSELDLDGPCFIFRQLGSDSSLGGHCVAFQPTLQSVEAAPVVPVAIAATTEEDRTTLLESNPRLVEELEGAQIVPTTDAAGPDTGSVTPQSIYQVWVATQVPGSSSPRRFTFKSAEGKFLGADQNGVLRASMAARGPQEEWTLEASNRGVWMLRSVHNRYLGLDEVAGGKTVVRADADRDETDAASWNIKVQWKYRHAARHSVDAKTNHRSKANDPTAVQLGARDQVLAQELETFKSRAGSQYLPSNYASTLSKEERKALRKAEKEGRLAEAMLDRRSKLKSDKYA